MAEHVADRFIHALQILEQSKDVKPMAALYQNGALIGNNLTPDHFQGADGASQFWQEYRSTFETVKSEFRNIITTENRAALEWTTVGTSFDGAPIHYSGVSILEIDGAMITRFCAYFDPHALGRQIKETSNKETSNKETGNI